MTYIELLVWNLSRLNRYTHGIGNISSFLNRSLHVWVGPTPIIILINLFWIAINAFYAKWENYRRPKTWHKLQTVKWRFKRSLPKYQKPFTSPTESDFYLSDSQILKWWKMPHQNNDYIYTSKQKSTLHIPIVTWRRIVARTVILHTVVDNSGKFRRWSRHQQKSIFLCKIQNSSWNTFNIYVCYLL
jgi:hypothetical protein